MAFTTVLAFATLCLAIACATQPDTFGNAKSREDLKALVASQMNLDSSLLAGFNDLFSTNEEDKYQETSPCFTKLYYTPRFNLGVAVGNLSKYWYSDFNAIGLSEVDVNSGTNEVLGRVGAKTVTGSGSLDIGGKIFEKPLYPLPYALITKGDASISAGEWLSNDGIFGGEALGSLPASYPDPYVCPYPFCLTLPFLLMEGYYKYTSLELAFTNVNTDIDISYNSYTEKVLRVTPTEAGSSVYYVRIRDYDWNTFDIFEIVDIPESAQIVISIIGVETSILIRPDAVFPWRRENSGSLTINVPLTYLLQQRTVEVQTNAKVFGNLLNPFGTTQLQMGSSVDGFVIANYLELNGGSIAPPMCRPGGREVTVGCGEGSDYDDIQSAIDSQLVVQGDILLVCSGRYARFDLTKSLTILGCDSKAKNCGDLNQARKRSTAGAYNNVAKRDYLPPHNDCSEGCGAVEGSGPQSDAGQQLDFPYVIIDLTLGSPLPSQSTNDTCINITGTGSGSVISNLVFYSPGNSAAAQLECIVVAPEATHVTIVGNTFRLGTTVTAIATGSPLAVDTDPAIIPDYCGPRESVELGLSTKSAHYLTITNNLVRRTKYCEEVLGALDVPAFILASNAPNENEPADGAASNHLIGLLFADNDVRGGFVCGSSLFCGQFSNNFIQAFNAVPAEDLETPFFNPPSIGVKNPRLVDVAYNVLYDSLVLGSEQCPLLNIPGTEDPATEANMNVFAKRQENGAEEGEEEHGLFQYVAKVEHNYINGTIISGVDCLIAGNSIKNGAITVCQYHDITGNCIEGTTSADDVTHFGSIDVIVASETVPTGGSIAGNSLSHAQSIVALNPTTTIASNDMYQIAQPYQNSEAATGYFNPAAIIGSHIISNTLNYVFGGVSVAEVSAFGSSLVLQNSFTNVLGRILNDYPIGGEGDEGTVVKFTANEIDFVHADVAMLLGRGIVYELQGNRYESLDGDGVLVVALDDSQSIITEETITCTLGVAIKVNQTDETATSIAKITKNVLTSNCGAGIWICANNSVVATNNVIEQSVGCSIQDCGDFNLVDYNTESTSCGVSPLCALC